MLDIRFIRENKKLVESSAKHKGYKVDIDDLLKQNDKRIILQQKIDDLRQRRNELATSTQGVKPTQEAIQEGQEIKTQISQLQSELDVIVNDYQASLEEVPNVIPEDTPKGGEQDNETIKEWGNTEKRNFNVQDHLAIGEKRGWIDFERGAKVSGAKFYFLKGDYALLELALTQYVLAKAASNGFIPMLVPNMVSTRTAAGAGFLPRSEERQIYKIEGSDLNLIPTAEMPITGYHSDEIIDLSGGPLLYVGYSPCYRLEAGAYGKHAKGLFRTHQFNKVELYAFTQPDQSEKMHLKILALEEEICQELGIPYRIVRIAAGDLGAPAYKKFDIEYWSPVDMEYRELTSCSNITDYQARRLNIRYRTAEGKTEYVHTLNGTAMPLSRGPIALVENYQQADGSVHIPAVLKQYFGNREIL